MREGPPGADEPAGTGADTRGRVGCCRASVVHVAGHDPIVGGNRAATRRLRGAPGSTGSGCPGPRWGHRRALGLLQIPVDQRPEREQQLSQRLGETSLQLRWYEVTHRADQPDQELEIAPRAGASVSGGLPSGGRGRSPALPAAAACPQRSRRSPGPRRPRAPWPRRAGARRLQRPDPAAPRGCAARRRPTATTALARDQVCGVPAAPLKVTSSAPSSNVAPAGGRRPVRGAA